MAEIINPHDRLFRQIWSRKDVAMDFFDNYLPEDVKTAIDLSKLEICKDTFIEKELKDYLSDLLYKVQTDSGSGYVYLLFEHKSYDDKLGSLQILEYMTRIWRTHIKQNPHNWLPFPPIIPILIYHGKTRWQHGTRFSHLFDENQNKLSDFIPNFRFLLYDLSQYDDNDIKGAVINRVTMLLFKYVFHQDFLKKLPDIFRILNELSDAKTGLEYIETIFRYLISTVDDITAAQLKTIVEESTSKDKGDILMTLAEQLKNEGYQKGIKQGIKQGLEQGIKQGILKGMVKGKKETAKNLLRLGVLTEQQIAMATDLDIDTVRKLKNDISE